MMRRIVMLTSLGFVAAAGILAIEDINAIVWPEGMVEERVHADLIRARINGHWVEFPMVALSERICSSNDPVYQRYCR